MQLSSGCEAPKFSSVIDAVRIASRQLVRELGFMSESLAGTDLPPSAVHALIEIDARDAITARELGDILRLEKSSISRMLQKLVLSGDIIEKPSEEDGRFKVLSLSVAGQDRVAAIHTFARKQVATALGRLAPGQHDIVVEGLRLYARSLGVNADDEATRSPIRIVPGYRSGLIGCITQMHARYYGQTAGFGRAFEASVADGLAAFSERLDRPCNLIWTAVLGDEIVGSIAIDGEDIGDGVAHLRWFMVADYVRGGGTGRELLSAALAFADESHFRKTHLWTFDGLAAARHLYQEHGFSCDEERLGSQWGSEVLEQRFVRPHPRIELVEGCNRWRRGTPSD